MKCEERDLVEDDELWELLKSASRQEPRGSFVDDALRLARQEGVEVRRSWFGFLRPALAGVFAVALVGSGWLMLRDSGQPEIQVVEESPDEADLVSLEEDLSEELLWTAAEEPWLFSDAEVLAMLD